MYFIFSHHAYGLTGLIFFALAYAALELLVNNGQKKLWIAKRKKFAATDYFVLVTGLVMGCAFALQGRDLIAPWGILVFLPACFITAALIESAIEAFMIGAELN